MYLNAVPFCACGACIFSTIAGILPGIACIALYCSGIQADVTVGGVKDDVIILFNFGLCGGSRQSVGAGVGITLSVIFAAVAGLVTACLIPIRIEDYFTILS